MTHLTLEKRSQLSVLVKLGKKQQDMAEILEISQSTVSRELKRVEEDYCHHSAQMDADSKRYHAYGKRRSWTNNAEYMKYLMKQLREKWSPEQIVGDLRRQRKYTVSARTIYTYIWKNNGLHKYLRRKGRHHWKGCSEGSKFNIKNRRDISERPRIVDSKRRYGDWESDLVEGKDHIGAIATFVECKTKYLSATLLKNQTSKEFLRASKRVFKCLPKQLKRTLTHDNGNEIACHEKITGFFKVMVYCATPYHAWERGLNEHTNGLLREYFPKGTDFRTITQRDLDRVVKSINTRPRHCLSFRTPEMAFNEVMRKYAFHSSE